MEITITIDDNTAKVLSFLDENDDVRNTVLRLIDHAHQGVYRPGSWERDWLYRVFLNQEIQAAEERMYAEGVEPKRGV